MVVGEWVVLSVVSGMEASGGLCVGCGVLWQECKQVVVGVMVVLSCVAEMEAIVGRYGGFVVLFCVVRMEASGCQWEGCSMWQECNIILYLAVAVCGSYQWHTALSLSCCDEV